MSIKRAGPISGNPVHGLCFRECIEVNKVFDGCITRTEDVVFTVRLPGTGAPFPYRFISARSFNDTALSNVNIMPIEDRRSRVSFDATVPVSVVFVDAEEAQHTVSASVAFHREVILHMPAESLTPYKIAADTSLVAIAGTFISPTELRIRCCVVQVSKVLVKVELLVPSYGYCEYPVCEEMGDCEEMGTIPLFPPLI